MAMRNVLIIEDDAMDANAISRVVRPHVGTGGIHLAGTMHDAMRMMAAMRFDLIILDLRLPDTAIGSEAISQLAVTKSNTPVIVVTAMADPNVLESVERMGWPCVRKYVDVFDEHLNDALLSVFVRDTAGVEMQRSTQLEAIANAIERIELRQEQQGRDIAEMKQEMFGGWTVDSTGKRVRNEGCFERCQRLDQLVSAGKKVGGEALSKAGIAIASVIAGVVGTGVLWLIKTHLSQ